MARFVAVGQLEAGRGVGHGGRGVVLVPEFGQREQAGRLGASALQHRLPPQPGDRAGHDQQGGDGGRNDDAAAPRAPLGERRHGADEGLLGGGQPARVALAPELELPEGRAGPEQVVRPAVLVPHVGRLAQLVAQLGALGVLGLPAHQPRPGGEQRLVDDLDAPPDSVALLAPDLERGQEPRIDQRLQDHGRRRARVEHGRPGGPGLVLQHLRHDEDRQELLDVPGRPRPLRRDQVAEELPHDRPARFSDLRQGRLGVPRQRAPHPAHRVVRLAGEVAGLAVALLPQLRRGERDQRKRAALLRHLAEHLLDHRLVGEAVAAGQRRLDQRPPQVRAGRRIQGRQLGKQRLQAFMLVALNQEVVAHGKQDADAGVERDPAQQFREA